MALWRCLKCYTLYSVDAPQCPHCGSKQHHEEGTLPPKKVRK